jgi:hypothetical protein
MFAKSRKFPIEVNQKQILYPLPDDDDSPGKERSVTKRELKQTSKILENGGMVFRYLSDEEEMKFRAYARSNYEAFTEIVGVWHPVYQDECVRINHEKSYYRKTRFASQPE